MNLRMSIDGIGWQREWVTILFPEHSIEWSAIPLFSHATWDHNRASQFPQCSPWLRRQSVLNWLFSAKWWTLICWENRTSDSRNSTLSTSCDMNSRILLPLCNLWPRFLYPLRASFKIIFSVLPLNTSISACGNGLDGKKYHWNCSTQQDSRHHPRWFANADDHDSCSRCNVLLHERHMKCRNFRVRLAHGWAEPAWYDWFII